MRKVSQQKGATILGMIIFFALVGFFAFLALKIGPIYIENINVKNSLKGVQDKNLVVSGKPKPEIEDALIISISKAFRINGIENADIKNLKIGFTQDGVNLELKYEVREHMAGNLDIIVSFDDNVFIRKS